MNKIVFLFFRRMRAPLIVLLSAYSISIAGLVLMPGMDNMGNPWKFDFFHAFYFVSFMGSTIGFGEIPYEFSTAQRMWTTLSIYLTVIAWLYAIGKILTLTQDANFKRAVTEQRFNRAVRNLTEPFHLICGYGETGSLLARKLTEAGIQCVVIDSDSDKINDVLLDDLSLDVPAFCADASEVTHLIEGGVTHPLCQTLIAITDSDKINVKIAVSSKLLRPDLKVVSRAESKAAAANLASFKTDHIINPFETFANILAMSLRTPTVEVLYDAIIKPPRSEVRPPQSPPRGNWIVCGYGRFGREVCRFLEYEGVTTTIIEPNPETAPETAVIGLGTEAVTLRQAGIEKAAGIVAGSEDDANNLSIIMTARELNPNLYFIARLNQRSNEAIFEAAKPDRIMESSLLIVDRILPLLTAPLLNRFLQLARHRNEEWAQDTMDTINHLCDYLAPNVWAVIIDEERAPAVAMAIDEGRSITINMLMRDPKEREVIMPCVPLMLAQGKKETMQPDEDTVLELGDGILFAGKAEAERRMPWILNSSKELEYVETGEERPEGYFWRWLAAREARKAEQDITTPPAQPESPDPPEPKE